MIDDLQLLSGNDIPFEEAQLVIHPPTIKEIAYIGEDSFFIGCELLKFSKDNLLNKEDKSHLENYTDFDILMSIMSTKEKSLQKNVEDAFSVLNLLFPNYEIKIVNNYLSLTDSQGIVRSIDNSNFNIFKEILTEIFNLHDNQEKNTNYNPSGDLSKRIAEKLKKRHQQLAKAKGNGQKISVFERYISILSVGLQKDMNALLNYTVYQLLDEFRRYRLYIENDIYIKAKLAGAKDLKEPEDWMQDIH